MLYARLGERDVDERLLFSQIFYVADMGKTADGLMNSVFIEKLHARGYEVFLLTDPLDEILFQNLRKWK